MKRSASAALTAAVLLALPGIAGCAGHMPAGMSNSNAPSPHVITAETIVQSGAKTVWDALERTVHFYVFHSNGRIEHRGRSSLVLSEQPILVLDGVRLNDVTVLINMPAADVDTIEVLDGINATTYYGTNAGSGVIRIWTKS
jgi:outer membrane cobalamin receptor